MKTPPATSRGRLLALLAALLILPGLWLRFERLEWMEFGHDELSILCSSYRAGHEQFALHGIPASIGLPLPNFLLYMLALPLSCTRDPVAIVACVALWNLLGLVCVLRLLWGMVPPAAAIAGTALLASAPGPLLLSRKIWNPDLLFGGIACLLLLLALQMKRPRHWATAGVLATGAIVCGFHASAWPLLPCALAWAWLLRVPLERRGLCLGAFALLVLFAPYAWYFISSGFDDLRGIWTAQASQGPNPESWLAAFARHARAALSASCSGGLLESGSGGSWSGRAARAGALGFAGWTALASSIVVLRVPWLVRRAWQGREVSAFDKLLALGALFEIVLLACYAQAHMPSLPHYYAVLIPFPTLAALWLGLRIGQVPLVAATALVVTAHTLLFTGFLDELQRHGPPPGMHYAAAFQPQAARWRAEIERAFDEIDSGHAAEREAQRRLQSEFEAAQDVLLRYDARRDEPPVTAQGRLEWHPGPAGLEVIGSSALDMLRLPPFELGGRGRALLRLELWSPKDVAGWVLYVDAAHPDYAHGQALELRTRPGENVVYLRIPDPDVCGRLMLRHGAHRWLLRAAEVRRVED